MAYFTVKTDTHGKHITLRREYVNNTRLYSRQRSISWIYFTPRNTYSYREFPPIGALPSHYVDNSPPMGPVRISARAI